MNINWLDKVIQIHSFIKIIIEWISIFHVDLVKSTCYMKKSILLVFLMFLYSGTTLTLHAQIFSQNFSSSSVLNDYISNTPTSGQFSAIVNSSGVVSSITNGQLRMVKTAQVASYF